VYGLDISVVHVINILVPSRYLNH